MFLAVEAFETVTTKQALTTAEVNPNSRASSQASPQFWKNNLTVDAPLKQQTRKKVLLLDSARKEVLLLISRL